MIKSQYPIGFSEIHLVPQTRSLAVGHHPHPRDRAVLADTNQRADVTAVPIAGCGRQDDADNAIPLTHPIALANLAQAEQRGLSLNVEGVVDDLVVMSADRKDFQQLPRFRPSHFELYLILGAQKGPPDGD